MPRLSQQLPRYRKHRASGQAIVTLNGRDHYMGPHGSKASRLEYDRLISEWLAAGRQLPAPQTVEGLTVVEVMAAYCRFARTYYRKNGLVTREACQIREALRFVRRLYGRLPVGEFGPKKLAAVRQAMIDADLSRSVINKQTGRIRRMFKWAVAEELCPPHVLEGLRAVGGLKKGRSTARESDPIMPVADAVVQATLPRLSSVLADMVRFQRLTGCRPGEVCELRPRCVDRSSPVWKYVPDSHKTEHQGRERIICIGPKAQAVLAPYLLRGADQYCFSPKESEKMRREERTAARKTPPSCGNRPGTNRKKCPRRSAGDCYTAASYRRAIHRAVEALNKARQKNGEPPLEKWAPNQLRHSAGTEIRRRFGLEGAQVCLGHAAADVTQIYAERDLARAEEIMRQIG